LKQEQEQEQERRQRRQHEGDAAWESFCAGVSFNSPGLSLVLTTKHGSPNLRYLDLDLTIVHHPATKRAIVSTQKNSTSGPPCKKSRTEKKEEENPAVSTVIKGPPDDFVLWKASTTASSTTTTTTRQAPAPAQITSAAIISSRPAGGVISKKDDRRADVQRQIGTTALHYESCHPPHVLTGGPVGQMVRLARNCTAAVVGGPSSGACGAAESPSVLVGKEEAGREFLRHARVLSRWLRLRGYPARVLRRAVAVAMARLRSGALVANPETGRAHHSRSFNRHPSNVGPVYSFPIICPFRGQTQRDTRCTERLLNSVLQSAARFYDGQGTGGESLSAMFRASRASVIHTTSST
jgi:hypothetical protein